MTGLAACGAAMDSWAPGKAEAEAFEGPVPRAECGPGSLPDTAMQGQVPAEDQASGRAALGYNCNMELVGHEGTGPLNWQMAWYEDCAYYDRDFPTATTLVQANDLGVVVVDASTPSHPVRTTTLTSAAMLDPHESLAVSEKRGLLAGVAGYDALGEGPVFFDVYDVSEDCRYPELKASVPAQIPEGHEGDWAPDGLTYYGSSLWSGVLTAIDVTDPASPRPFTVIPTGLTHGLSTSEDGTRAYLAQLGLGGVPNGMEIWDVSAVQEHTPGARATRIGSVYWADGQSAQHTIPVTIQGKPYVIHVDEFGSGSAIGVARIIDISDETAPFIVSKLKLEVHMPENQDALAADSDPYQGHYCWVPKRDEPGVVGCSYLPSGLRVFDIRDPYFPKEIAYFNPGRPGNLASRESARVRFVPERGEVWFTDQHSGFYVMRFTNGVWPFRE